MQFLKKNNNNSDKLINNDKKKVPKTTIGKSILKKSKEPTDTFLNIYSKIDSDTSSSSITSNKLSNNSLKTSSTVSSIISDLRSSSTLESKRKEKPKKDIIDNLSHNEEHSDKLQALRNLTSSEGETFLNVPNSKELTNNKNDQNNTKSTKKYKHKHKNKNKDSGPISLAVLTDTGILIKSRKPTVSELAGRQIGRSSREFINSRVSMSSSTRSFRSSTDNESFFETASLISCVTCLSDEDDDGTFEVSSNSSLDTHSHRSHTKSENSKQNNNSYSSINGQLPTNSVIAYSRILNAENIQIDEKLGKLPIEKDLLPNQHIIEITFAKPTRHEVKPKTLTLLIEHNEAEIDLADEILKRSYRNSKRFRSILVIINPFGGKRNAKKIFKKKSKPLLLASKFAIDMVYTKYPGHATDIARNMDIDRYDTVLCASGDGVPHEVINGLYRREDRTRAFNKLAITEIPCGSGNAMSVSCHWTNNPSYATLFLIKSIEKRIDIMCCSQPSSTAAYPRLSFLSQTYGIIAESDINTEFIRWMGPARFELGVAFNILQRKKYPCDIYVKYHAKSKNDLKSHYLKYKKAQDGTNLAKIDGMEIINPEVTYIDDNDRGSEITPVDVKLGELDLETEISIESKIYDEEEEEIDNFVTEDSFNIKYKYEDGVPSDWEKIDSSITNNLGIFYSGKMPYVAADTKFFPAALPADGCMDMVITDSRTPFTRMVPILLALDKGSHVLQPEVIHSKVLAYKLIPRRDDKDRKDSNNKQNQDDRDNLDMDYNPNGLYSIDGEEYPLVPLQVEVLPKLCKTLLRNGRYVDTEFDKM